MKKAQKHFAIKLPRLDAKTLKALLPYIAIALLATKLGQAYRLTSGADVLDRLLGVFAVLGAALQNPLPSLHPFDLLTGAAAAGLVRLTLYCKAKNRKKYRHGAEYGTARWGGPKDIAPFINPNFSQNILLTDTERLTLGEIADPEKRNVNLNVLVIGGSGSGKTRYHIKPNLLQMNGSYVCSDPKGTVVEEVGRVLMQKGGYKLKILNTIDFSASMHYNPFCYLHSETDILSLVTVIMENTQGKDNKGGEDFWRKAEALLYQALIAYIYYEAPAEEKNMSMLLDMLNACECREDDENFKSAVDLLFERLQKKSPNHFAVRQYVKFKMAAGKTLKSILISCGARLAAFDIQAVRDMMEYVGLEQGYISSITTPDNVKLSHKDDKRDNSGWMYVVNGKHPNVGLNAYELQKGDVITWHWCDDYTIEEGSEKWSGSRVIEYIENLIKLIGEVDASDACKARINKARAAYDKLTDAEKQNVSNYQTLQDAEAKYRSLTGMDALVSLIEEQTWTVSMNDANDAAAVKTWLEAKLNALELNGTTATATVTALTAATAGTADNKSGTDGSFTFDVTLAVGEGGAQDSRNLTGMTGTITATKLISSDAGVASVSVGGKAGKVDGNTITVVLDYADDAAIPSDANSVSIVTVDPDAQVSDLTTSDEGVTWTFTVTAQDGTKVEYTIHVSIAENPAEGNKAAVAAAKSMLENASFTYASKDVNSEDAAKTAVEKQIEALLSDKGVSFEVTMTGFTAAQDGTAENESGTNGSFSFTVKLTKGEAETSAEDSVSLSGTITPAQYVKSTNAGVSELKVAGTTATISGNSFTVTVPYDTEITASLFEITLADSKATYTSPVEENGVWSFTVTAEDGSTTATYTVTVTIGKNPEQDSNQKDVDDAKATITSKTFDVKQEDINSEAAMKRYIEDMLRGLGFDGIDMQVEITSFNAAVAGDSQNKDGVNGSFTATVKLTKGSGDALAESSVSISGTIFATAYSGGNPNPPTPPSRDTYTLTFDTNGGSALKSVDVKAGTTIDLAQYVPVRAGYTFLGWYSDSALKNAVTSITLNRNTTVYAKWDKQNTPSVKNPFTDVKPGDWFYDDVMFVYEKKLMMGTSSTLFSPNEAATRAMLATILWRMDGSPAPKSSAGYSDVPTGQWYSDAIAWATEKGIFEGYGNGTFGPNDPITREQLAAIFYRYASHKGYDMSAVGSLEQFSDKDKASSWALDALKWAIGSGLMNGKGNALDPTGTATRAEIAAMLHRLVDKYGLVPSTTPSGNTQWTIRSPRTYDSSALGTWNFMLCASAAALLALITAEKRRRQVNYAR